MDKKADKKTILLLAGVIITVISAVVLTAGLFGASAEATISAFPVSTLSVEEDTLEYREIEGTELRCPYIPYIISLPGEIYMSSADMILSETDDYKIAMVVSNRTFEDVIKASIGEKLMESIDLPETEWSEYVSGTGYINSYSTAYKGGILKINSKMNTEVDYAVAYEVTARDMEKNLVIFVACKNADMLDGAKNLLDAMVYTLVPEDVTDSVTDEISTENIPETENTGSRTDVEGENEGETDGKSYQLYSSSNLSEAYVLFWYEAGTGDVSGIHLTTPEGTKIYPDESISSEGCCVFFMKGASSGTYFINVKEVPQGVSYELMSEERYLLLHGN